MRPRVKRRCSRLQTHDPQSRFRKERLRERGAAEPPTLSRHAPSEGSLHHCFLLRERAYATHRTIVMSKRPESFIPPLGQLPRPVAFAPRQSSSLSHEPPAGRAAYSSEHAFAQRSSAKYRASSRARRPNRMIRSLATTATSSRGGSKNGNRIGGLVGNAVRKSSTSLHLG